MEEGKVRQTRKQHPEKHFNEICDTPSGMSTWASEEHPSKQFRERKRTDDGISMEMIFWSCLERTWSENENPTEIVLIVEEVWCWVGICWIDEEWWED
jgi:hypothetical protein